MTQTVNIAVGDCDS